MDESPYVANDRDFDPGEADSKLVLGVIGHENVDNAYELGSNGGPIYARVQLFSGRDHTQPVKAGRMQGAEMMARVPSTLSSLPPKGTEVLIAFPDGMATKPHAPVIIAVLDRVVAKANYGNLKEAEACLAATADAPARVMVKDDNSITMYTTDDGKPTGHGVYLKLSSTALEFYAPWGRLVFDASGFHVVTASGARMDLGGIGGIPGPLSTLASYATLSAATVKCAGSIVMLGAGPVYNAGLYGLTGIAGLPSTGVFLSA